MIRKKAKKKPPQKKPSKILTAQEPAPFQTLNLRGRGKGLIICDHSSNRVPRSLKKLGLKTAELNRHIGWDIGTEDIGRHLSKVLDMPAVLAGYSRLVVDLNRDPDYHECIPAISDHTVIPPNVKISKKEREQRLRELFWPYQKEISRQVDRFVKKNQIPLLLAIHSFTPEMNDIKRPWHISILWNKEEKIAKKLIAEIRRRYPQFLVGSNEPYSLKDERFTGSTMHRHGEERDIPYIFVEFRQDLIDTKEKAREWAERFILALRPILENF